MVLGLDHRHQGVAKQLSAIAAAALLTGEEAINGEQAQVGMLCPLAEDPQGETGGGSGGLGLLKDFQAGGGLGQLRGRSDHEDQWFVLCHGCGGFCKAGKDAPHHSDRRSSEPASPRDQP